MKLNELRQSWTKSDPLTLIHKILPDTKIQLVPAEAGRRGRHFIARVNGEWIMQSTWIRPFRTLDDAAKAVDEAAQLDAQTEGDPNFRRWVAEGSPKGNWNWNNLKLSAITTNPVNWPVI